MNALRAGMQSRATSQVVKPVANRWWYREDFETTFSVSLAATGAGSAALAAVADRPGVVQQSAAAAGVDGHRILITSNSNENIVPDVGMTYQCGVRIPTLANGVDNFVVRCGLLDAATALVDAVDGIYFEYDFGTYGDNFWRICASSNSVRTKVATGTLIIAGNWHRLSWSYTSAGIVATVQDVTPGGNTTTATVTTNIPNTAARATFPQLQLGKSLGATARTVQWDYVEMIQDFTTATMR